MSLWSTQLGNEGSGRDSWQRMPQVGRWSSTPVRPLEYGDGREGSAQGSLVRRLLVFYVLTRAGLYALVGASFVWPENGGPLRSIRIYPLSSVAAANPAALRPFANWDADHYIQIAGAGYSGRLPAFFPLFPALMRIVALGRPEWMIAAGLLINVVAGCVAAVLLLKLIHIDHPRAAWPATVLI